MSGHSKWNNIKRTKEKSDAEKGKIFTKLVRELSVIVKTGGSDPNSNSRLRDIIVKCRQNNVPSDSIARNIKKFSGEGEQVNYEDITYEGYGTGGVAVMVECLTDNRNRTASDVRHAFDKFGGSLGTTGSVSYLFTKQGVIIVDKSGVDYDTFFELVLLNDGYDIEELEDSYVVTTSPDSFSKVLSVIEENKYTVLSSNVEYVPASTIELDESQKATFEKMLALLEDSDDVQEVFHNAILD